MIATSSLANRDTFPRIYFLLTAIEKRNNWKSGNRVMISLIKFSEEASSAESNSTVSSDPQISLAEAKNNTLMVIADISNDPVVTSIDFYRIGLVFEMFSFFNFLIVHICTKL